MVSTFSRNHFGDIEPLQRALAVVAAMILFALHCKEYDLATAAFFAFGLGLMARQSWLAYLAVFVIGCVNRETTVLLALVFAVHYWRRVPLTTWLSLLAIQLVTFVIIRAGLMLAFADLPGSTYWWQWERNWQILTELQWVAGLHVLGAGLVLGIAVLKWSKMPEIWRAAFVVLIVALSVFYLLFGRVGEIRVFIEAFPIVWCALTYG
jgi:hypothetical protein